MPSAPLVALAIWLLPATFPIVTALGGLLCIRLMTKRRLRLHAFAARIGCSRSSIATHMVASCHPAEIGLPCGLGHVVATVACTRRRRVRRLASLALDNPASGQLG